MGWTAASTQTTGHTVTATEWNELVNNDKYLKGQAGTVTFEDGFITQELIPDANNTHDIGTNATRYKNGYFAGTLGVTGTITAGGYTSPGLASVFLLADLALAPGGFDIETDISWTGERFDTANIHSLAGAEDHKLTVPVTGKYLISGQLLVSSATATYFTVHTNVNDVNKRLWAGKAVAGTSMAVPINTLLSLTANDYVTIFVTVLTGAGDITIEGDADGLSSWVDISYVGV